MKAAHLNGLGSCAWAGSTAPPPPALLVSVQLRVVGGGGGVGACVSPQKARSLQLIDWAVAGSHVLIYL